MLPAALEGLPRSARIQRVLVHGGVLPAAPNDQVLQLHEESLRAAVQDRVQSCRLAKREAEGNIRHISTKYEKKGDLESHPSVISMNF